MRTHREGFTLVELAVVTLILVILAGVAVPRFQSYIYTAKAATVISDIQTVRLAAYEYHLDTNQWPADVNRGIVPPELEPYLGSAFTFTRDDYMLDWDYWVLPDGSPSHPETGTLVGISLTTPDEKFGQAFLQLLGEGTAKATITDHYTFVLIAAE